MLFKIEQSCKLQKAILANQDAIWKTRLFQVDHITVEILSTDLHEFWIKSVGFVSKRNNSENGLMVALPQAYVRNVGHRF